MGRRPRSTTSQPDDMIPDANAVLTATAESLASVAMATSPWNVLPMAFPSWRTTSGVRSPLTAPLTPLAPKIVVDHTFLA